MKCVSKEWYKGEQYRCVLASDTVPAVLPTDGTNVDGMEDYETFAPLSMLYVVGKAEHKEYGTDESGTFVAQRGEGMSMNDEILRALLM